MFDESLDAGFVGFVGFGTNQLQIARNQPELFLRIRQRTHVCVKGLFHQFISALLDPPVLTLKSINTPEKIGAVCQDRLNVLA